MKKIFTILFGIFATTTLAMAQSDNATNGVATVLNSSGRISCEWVQLWENGPRWATFNVGATITSYDSLSIGSDPTPFDSVTELAQYYNTANIGGLYPWGNPYQNGRMTVWNDSVITGICDIATTIWGSNWKTPTEQELDSLTGGIYTTWTFCDGDTIQYVPGCTLKGYMISGVGDFENNSIFVPAAGDFDYFKGKVMDVSLMGSYWSDTRSGVNDDPVYMYFQIESGRFQEERGLSYGYPTFGHSVRAVLIENTPIGVDKVQVQPETIKCKKFIHNGLLYIQRGNVIYNAMGVVVKILDDVDSH